MNDYSSQRTKLGNLMNDLMKNAAKTLIKHAWLYWLLNFTWGFLMTFAGLLVSLVLICIGRKPMRWQRTWFFNVGDSWGGCSIGVMFLRDSISVESINEHEHGHMYQNAILGPLFIFVVAIPSAIRYWHFSICEKKGVKTKDYDAIWFEGNASEIGRMSSKQSLKEDKKDEVSE